MFGALAAGHGLEVFRLFTGTGVLDKMADVDGAVGAGVGALEAGVVRLYSVVVILAERAGIGPTTLNRIENDHAEPHFRTIRKLAKALNIDAANLIPKE